MLAKASLRDWFPLEAGLLGQTVTPMGRRPPGLPFCGLRVSSSSPGVGSVKQEGFSADLISGNARDGASSRRTNEWCNTVALHLRRQARMEIVSVCVRVLPLEAPCPVR